MGSATSSSSEVTRIGYLADTSQAVHISSIHAHAWGALRPASKSIHSKLFKVTILALTQGHISEAGTHSVGEMFG
jgi:hypothetical protein